jgi:hypothetical protein
MTEDEAVSSGDNAAGVLVGHPLTARLLRAGQRLRQWDSTHRWALDTAVVLAVFLVFCLPDLVNNGSHQDGPIAVSQRPLPEMLLVQAGLVIPLWWRRRAPLLALHAVVESSSSSWPPASCCAPTSPCSSPCTAWYSTDRCGNYPGPCPRWS